MKSYTRSAIYLTLEQTVNRKAASPSQGLVPFHNNPDAIKRWCVSANQRHMSVGQMESMKNVDKIEKPSAQNTKWRIDKDNLDRKNLQDCIKSSCNPFDGLVVESQKLINIATGKASSAKAQEFLAHVLEKGNADRLKFETECSQDKTRFLKPITKISVHNFAKDNQVIDRASGKQSNVESVRDSFIQLLFSIAHQVGIDMDNVLAYPFTMYPLPIAYSDGQTMKTNKASLLHKLEE